MSESTKYEVRAYRPGDEEAILEMFNRCFAEVDPGFVPRSMDVWRWQYLQNPAGTQISVAHTAEGELFSHYAGIPQVVQYRGERGRISQAVDSVTDPRFRAGLKKPGMFVVLGLDYWDRYAGNAPEREPIVWGLPVPVAWRMGERFLEYTLIRCISRLVLDFEDPLPGRAIDAAAAASYDVEQVSSVPDDIDRLFERASEGRGLVTVRDRDYLTWRFLTHPERTYELWTARDSARELRGYAVYRTGPFDGEQSGLVADWWLDPSAQGCGDALLAALAERTRAAGQSKLQTLVSDTAPEWAAFQAQGFRAVRTGYPLVARIFPRRLDVPWLHANWYLTLGDTDLV